MEFPGGSVVKTALPMQMAQVPSLVRKLRSFLLCDQKVKKKIFFFKDMCKEGEKKAEKGD